MAAKGLMEEFLGDFVMDGVLFNEPMKDHTTLRIGGPAEMYLNPKDTVSLQKFLPILKEKGVPLLPLGGGSNILVQDEGIGGAVISLSLLNKSELIKENSAEVILLVESGVPLQRFITIAKERGFAGVEGLVGIPGCMGGAIKGNAGSFGYEIKDIIESVTVIDRDGRVSILEKGQISFRYRSSGIADEAIILSAQVRLKRDNPQEIAWRMHTFLEEKRRKQPISEWSAGCVFKNPHGAAAGKLIDEARCKGLRRGDIEVSTLHANYFINRGRGTAADFLSLMDDVRGIVFKSAGIELEPEIHVVGRQCV